MAIDLASIIAVFALSATAEILIAVPIGVFGFGMDPLFALLVGYPANLIPMIVILALFEFLERRFPRFSDSLEKRGRRFRERLKGKYGFAFLFLIIPIAGVYGASAATGFLRIDKRRSFLTQCLALAFFGAVEVIFLYLGIRLIGGS